MNIDPAVGEQPRRVAPAHAAGEADVRQTARHRTEDRHSVGAQVEDPADGDRADDGHEAARYRLQPASEHDQRREDGHRDGEGRARGLADLLERVPELDHRAARAARRHIGRRHAEHPADLAHRHLDADAGQEADQHRSRDEVREKAEAGQPGEEEKPAGEQRAHARQRKPLRTTPAADRRSPSEAIPANMIAAVAESPPTTRCRDEPNTAKTRTGNRIV